MNALCHAIRRIGLSLLVALVGISGFVFGFSSIAPAQTKYLPDAPLVPTITNNEGPAGAFGLPPLHPPPPGGFDQESIWNMKKIGWMSDLGCSNSDQMWAEHQGSRYILYVGSATGTVYNPLTKQNEACGAQIYDVTNPAQPVFLGQIPGTSDATSGIPHVFVCSGKTLPNAPN